MVKLGSKEHVRAAERSRASPVCYICGAANANWSIYSSSKSSTSSGKNPFFPFLEYHVPPSAARPIETESGRVDACTVCFSFLAQQWRAYEEKGTPIVKRLYWLKRSGIDGNADKPGEQREEGDKNDQFWGNLGDMHDLGDNNKEHQVSKVQSQSDHALCDGDNHTIAKPEPCVKHVICTSQPSPPVFETQESHSPSLDLSGKKPASLEMCYVCSRQKPKEFMRSVHTRAQLKTETPFYPCLSKHNPAPSARKMDYLGKVLVCEACQKFLFRQWQVFQKNNTPLSERQYQLRSDPSLPREQQSQLSTMVCFICGVTQPATSGRFLYSGKHTPGDPYYPFLNSLKPPLGAMPLTKQGLTRACSGCRKSLHRQWKQFEASVVPEEQREYRIRNEAITVSVPSSLSLPCLPTASMSSVSLHKPEEKFVCYTCAELCEESSMRPIYTKIDTNPLNGSFCFPFIALLQPSQGCQQLDTMGRTLVCKKCFRFLQSKWEQFERENVPQQMRTYAVGKIENTQLNSQCNICFLCGTTYRSGMTWKLHSYPHSGEGIRDGGPFFPFLASREPKANAKHIDSEGRVVSCEICYANLMAQWQNYENSVVPEETNRWLRKYRVSQIICYLCGCEAAKVNCAPVSQSLVTLHPAVKVQRSSLLINRGRDVVLCDSCRKAIKHDLESTEDLVSDVTSTAGKEMVDDTQWEEALGGTQISQSQSRQDKSIIVINSSDSEDDGSSLVRQEGTHFSAVCHANVSPMHYTASASPGIQQPTSQSKDYPVSVSPGANMQPSTSRSFAAALRKLAKQAMPPGACSPTASTASGSQPASPTISHASSRSAGMSPSRSSPSASHTPPVTRAEGPGIIERLNHGTDKDLHSISTPSMPPIPALESDHRNQGTGDLNRAPTQGTHRQGPREQSEPSSHHTGHEVLPGVYSTRPGFPPEPAMLSEHYPGEHGPATVPYYMHGGKPPDMPLFVPRAGPLPGPPPLLASKRDGPEPHVVSPYFPGPFPPMMEPPEVHFETWRQRRAVEHLRQQHERQDVLGPLPGHADIASPKENAAEQEKDQDGPSAESREHMPMIHRVFYYNDNNKTSCPVHGQSTTGEPHIGQHQHGPARTEPMLPAKSERPEEFNHMFLPPHPDGAAMLHPFLVHPPRDGPFAPHHLGERHTELMRERERQELLLHQRMMIDQREHMKAREEEWQRRQQQLRQEKEEHQREMQQYRQQVLHQQQREMEQPRRMEQIGADQRRMDRSSKSPSGMEHPATDQVHENEMFRHYPFHSAFLPTQSAPPFADHHRKDNELKRIPMNAHKDGRTPHVHPFSFHGNHYPPFSESYPFHRERIVTSAAGTARMFSESDWPQHSRPTFVNGDLRTVELGQSEARRNMSPGINARIKVEKTDGAIHVSQPVKIKHDCAKLKFLEGLGLVTLDRKKELTHGDASIKRKYDDLQVVEQQGDKTSSDASRREEIEESSSEGTTDGESGTTSTDTDVSSKQLAEKLAFFARLGLVPPHTRQEMEQSFEVKRSERKKRKKKGRGRPSKRPRREDADSENGRSSIDAENFEGPITRQKQQQLREQTQDKNRPEESNGESIKNIPIRIKTERKEATPPYMFELRENNYHQNDMSHYHPSRTVTSDPLASRPPPRLTLQSLTNMEDPFTNYGASTFRPPYLRHTGLLSVSQETMQSDAQPGSQPVRPEPVRSTGISLVSEKETRDYLARRSSPGLPSDFGRQFGSLSGQQKSSFEKMVPGLPHPKIDPGKKDTNTGPKVSRLERREEDYRWPGVENVMKAYFLHAGDRELEMSVLQENSDMLKSNHVSLNEEANALSIQMTNLVQAKRQLVEDRRVYREDLDRLHYFMQSFQR